MANLKWVNVSVDLDKLQHIFQIHEVQRSILNLHGKEEASSDVGNRYRSREGGVFQGHKVEAMCIVEKYQNRSVQYSSRLLLASSLRLQLQVQVLGALE